MFPIDIWNIIFDYSDFSTKKNIKVVCKVFYNKFMFKKLKINKHDCLFINKITYIKKLDVSDIDICDKCLKNLKDLEYLKIKDTKFLNNINSKYLLNIELIIKSENFSILDIPFFKISSINIINKSINIIDINDMIIIKRLKINSNMIIINLDKIDEIEELYINSENLKFISNNIKKDLKVLEIKDKEIFDNIKKNHLYLIPNLIKFKLSRKYGTRIDDFTMLRTLEYLDVSNILFLKTTNKNIFPISLKYLNISKTNLESKHISNLINLIELDISYCNGFKDNDLKHLKNLKKLYTFKTGYITSNIKKMLPNIDIILDDRDKCLII